MGPVLNPGVPLCAPPLPLSPEALIGLFEMRLLGTVLSPSLRLEACGGAFLSCLL
jgi:hypothetical protein